MNLIDLVDNKGLQEDEWSFSRPRFGDDLQLTVVGWSGKTRITRGDKYYILRCTECSKDKELYGGGYFKSLKNALIKGNLPCGCGQRVNRTPEQYGVLCKRKANELGYTFLDFADEWKGALSKTVMLCDKHGRWSSGRISDLLYAGAGCPVCGTEAFARGSLKDDDLMIDSFFASGAFHPETKFSRSDKQSNKGTRGYWNLHCPDCGEKAVAVSYSLQVGHRPCGCSNQRQKSAYINFIIDGDNIIAIKFGIANDSKRREKEQNYKSVYKVEQFAVYTFEAVELCRKAELECKQTLETRVLSRTELPDGWSETTYVYNLEKIIEIYERNGGIRQENP